MKRMMRLSLLCLFLAGGLVAFFDPAFAVEKSTPPKGKKLNLFYTMPVSATLQITLKGAPVKGKPMKMEATVTSRTGTLKDMRISFQTSPELKMDMPVVEVAALRKGDQKKIPLSVEWDPKRITVDSFVRMVVEYTPDYDRLLAIVGNEKAYPDDFKRESLLKKIRDEQAKGSRTETTEYFPGLDADEE